MKRKLSLSLNSHYALRGAAQLIPKLTLHLEGLVGTLLSVFEICSPDPSLLQSWEKNTSVPHFLQPGFPSAISGQVFTKQILN